jgi:hypothetical protein
MNGKPAPLNSAAIRLAALSIPAVPGNLPIMESAEIAWRKEATASFLIWAWAEADIINATKRSLYIPFYLRTI